jgi:hypothetical protein
MKGSYSLSEVIRKSHSSSAYLYLPYSHQLDIEIFEYRFVQKKQCCLDDVLDDINIYRYIKESTVNWYKDDVQYSTIYFTYSTDFKPSRCKNA